MRLCSIASGSSGNCIYVGSEATHLLVDVGISGKKAEAGLNSLGLTGRDLDGILVTHEHMDHVAGLGVMARKYEVPIYATTGTLEEIQKMGNLGKIDPALFREVKEDVKLTIKDLTVNPMKISHDAAQPVGYRIAYGDKKVGICTDLGVYNDYTVECLKGMDALLLEANHDVKMLQVGPYTIISNREFWGTEDTFPMKIPASCSVESCMTSCRLSCWDISARRIIFRSWPMKRSGWKSPWERTLTGRKTSG